MHNRVVSVAGRLCAVFFLLAAVGALNGAALAQSAGAKAPDKKPSPAQQPARKVDEYAEIQRTLAGPAGNPECVWLGRRVVSLLWRDDLETAFRHLDLYDRFGCPGMHVQAAFRCLILHTASIDPKSPDSLNGRIEACWINPTEPAPEAPASSAAAPSPTTSR
ncbi:MAG: beta-1-3, beta-1-6-glucan biosynthesis protein [Xanthobacteraceae bacterium]